MKENQIERERKYLVKTNPEGFPHFPYKKIQQGYLARTGDQIEIRIRKKGSEHTLTVKKKREKGRLEREVPIRASDFKELWPLTRGKQIWKIRYEIPYQKHKIELDVYQGKARGLKTAEVEFKNASEEKNFSPPAWFGREITGSSRYSNWRLSISGYRPKKSHRRS